MQLLASYVQYFSYAHSDNFIYADVITLHISVPYHMFVIFVYFCYVCYLDGYHSMLLADFVRIV